MSPALPLRITLLDTWDEVLLELPADTPLTEVKRAVLARMKIRRSPGDYVVKYRGAELFEEDRTLAALGIPANAALIVLPRRRIPAK